MGAENISVIKVGETLMVTVPADPEDETVSALQEQLDYSIRSCIKV
jgi:hypothetical protein